MTTSKIRPTFIKQVVLSQKRKFFPKFSLNRFSQLTGELLDASFFNLNQLMFVACIRLCL